MKQLMRFLLLVLAVLASLTLPAQAQWQPLRGSDEDPDTELISAVNNFKSTTMWDEGS